jgi:arylsulfatase A-like enzyme
MNTKHLILIPIACLSTSHGFAAGGPRPNIPCILVDDVGYAHINAFGAHLQGTSVEKHYRETPCIDQLVREGMMFTQFYASNWGGPQFRR